MSRSPPSPRRCWPPRSARGGARGEARWGATGSPRSRERSAALERARIARELHDIVAHSLSVMVVQADGAAAAAEQRPDAAAAALRTIADTGRDALGQMRRLLGVLREERDAEMAPQPGAAQLDALVAQVAHAGLPAVLSVRGEPRPLEPAADVALYRVAQEALTNVLKHAGPVQRVDVEVRYDDDAVRARRARRRPGLARGRGRPWPGAGRDARARRAPRRHAGRRAARGRRFRGPGGDPA